MNYILKPREKVEPFSYLSRTDVVTKDDDMAPIFTYFNYSTFHLFVTPGRSDLPRFVESFKLVAKYHETNNPFADTLFCICGSGSDGFPETITSASTFSLQTLKRADHSLATGTDFLRCDSNAVSMSYEGGKCCISSERPLIPEFSLFLREHVATPHRGADFREPVRQLLAAHQL